MKTITIDDNDFESLKQLGIKTYENIELKLPIETVKEPQLYNGHTEAEWQIVIEGGFLVYCWDDVNATTVLRVLENSDISDIKRTTKASDYSIYRELGHIQPCLGIKPDLPDDVTLLVYFSATNMLYRSMEEMTDTNWDKAIKFIQLTEGTE